MSKSPPKLTGAADCAQILGLSRRQFDRLVKSGVLPQAEPRRYDLGGVVRAYVRYVAAGKEGMATIADAKLATERERARKLQIENEVRLGRLLWADQVGDSLSALTVAAVGSLEAIPGRYAAELAPITDPALMRTKLLHIVREFRAGYSRDIEEYCSRVEAGKGNNNV
jgi:predicted DNA-binding transcriptional regulator AlpA